MPAGFGAAWAGGNWERSCIWLGGWNALGSTGCVASFTTIPFSWGVAEEDVVGDSTTRMAGSVLVEAAVSIFRLLAGLFDDLASSMDAKRTPPLAAGLFLSPWGAETNETADGDDAFEFWLAAYLAELPSADSPGREEG